LCVEGMPLATSAAFHCQLRMACFTLGSTHGHISIPYSPFVVNLKGRDHFEDVCVGRVIVLILAFSSTLADDSRSYFHFKCPFLHLIGTAFSLRS
jgi:hypothetical protein